MIRRKLQILNQFCIDAETVLHLSPSDCVPQAEPDLPPPNTPVQDLCRTNARAAYLLALLACNGDQKCCDAAFEDYTEALAKCG